MFIAELILVAFAILYVSIHYLWYLTSNRNKVAMIIIGSSLLCYLIIIVLHNHKRHRRESKTPLLNQSTLSQLAANNILDPRNSMMELVSDLLMHPFFGGYNGLQPS